MTHKHFVPPLAHATPDPNHKTATARSRSARHEKHTSPVAVRQEQQHGTERLVLGIVWGAVAGLLAIAVIGSSLSRPRRQLTRYEKAMDRARDLNSRVHSWLRS